MDWLELLYQIFEVCIIPLLGVLTAFAINFLRAKKNEINAKTDNELIQKYTNLLFETISDCVIATNQTYVNTLKQQGRFDKEAQKEAFNKTYVAVLDILGDEAQIYLSHVFGDLEVYIMKRIEAEVSANRTSFPVPESAVSENITE